MTETPIYDEVKKAWEEQKVPQQQSGANRSDNDTSSMRKPDSSDRRRTKTTRSPSTRKARPPSEESK